MNEVLKEIKERRSIRKFKSDAIPQEILDQIIEAGLFAANGKGKQNTIMIQVSNKKLRDEISEMNRKIGGWNEGFDPFYGAPCMIIVLAKKDYKGAKEITAKSWIFLTLSGIATGGAWLLEYAALNFDGANPVAVNCIGKLSILLTMLLSWLVMKEKFTARSLIGLALLTAGIGLIIGFSL